MRDAPEWNFVDERFPAVGEDFVCSSHSASSFPRGRDRIALPAYQSTAAFVDGVSPSTVRRRARVGASMVSESSDRVGLFPARIPFRTSRTVDAEVDNLCPTSSGLAVGIALRVVAI